jgi:two-component system sensor histidine kinase AgrC
VLEVFCKILCAVIMGTTGYYMVKKIVAPDSKTGLKELLALCVFIIISIILHPIQYTIIYTISIFLLNIILYKFIFKITLEESIISCGILMIIIFFAEIIGAIFVRPILSIEVIRENYKISVFINLLISLVSIVIVNIQIIKRQISLFYTNILNKKAYVNIIFFLLLIIDISCLFYNMTINHMFTKGFIINGIIILICIVITFIFVQNQNSYKKLANDYDILFGYIQNFEDWIEKEQLNRHEYKNQLAVLRCLTKEKKVKNKIDEILEDNINIEGQEVTNLKNLPKGGIKGLMYYKAAIAQKQKINLVTDVSLEKNSILNKLSEKEIRVLCKLIGIYFDNAIEASSESRKKILTIEVYELKDKAYFVFSNTFKKHKNMKDRNQKGVSSKGKGRGNGLYFANKIIKENKWLEEKQEVIDNYYIQTVIINKKNKK